MITEQKLAIFEKYNGDIDAWTRAGTPQEKKTMSDPDWYEITEILQGLSLTQMGTNGKGGKSFAERIQQSIKAHAANERVAQRLLELSHKK